MFSRFAIKFYSKLPISRITGKSIFARFENFMKITKVSYDKNDGWNLSFPLEADLPQTLIIVFGASAYLENSAPLRELAEKFPASKIVGCSTAGEISDSTVAFGTLSGAIVRFEKTAIETAFAPVFHADESFAAGVQIAKSLSKPDLRGILILSDGLNVNGSELVKGINSVLPEDVTVTGGLAGDDAKFRKTWVLQNGEPQSNVVSAVGFYGENIKIGHGSEGGWDIFGPERRITKSKGNQLFELDGRLALDLYKDYLGERANQLPASALYFPLAIRSTTDDKQIVRTILNVDESSNSMIFAGDVPQGSYAQLMRGNFDHLIEGAADAAFMAQKNFAADKTTLSIAISCIGRRLILGERTEEELEAVLDELPENTTQIGFYSYGEISPFTSGYCDLHNETMTLTLISED